MQHVSMATGLRASICKGTQDAGYFLLVIMEVRLGHVTLNPARFSLLHISIMNSKYSYYKINEKVS